MLPNNSNSSPVKYDAPPWALNISGPKRNPPLSIPSGSLLALTNVSASDTTWIPPAWISTKFVGSANANDVSKPLPNACKTPVVVEGDVVLFAYVAVADTYELEIVPLDAVFCLYPAVVPNLTEYLNEAAVAAVVMFMVT